MIKLQLRVQLVRILYNKTPDKGHFVNFSLQNEEGDELQYDQKFVQADTEIVELDKLSSFGLELVVGHNKMTYCPFNLLFISKVHPSVVRKMPINKGRIVKHYLDHEIFAEIQPLEQVYTFENGQIIYSIRITSFSSIADPDEAEKLSAKFKKNVSMFSDDPRNSVIRSARDCPSVFEQKQTGIYTNGEAPLKSKTISEESLLSFLAVPEPTLKPKNSMAKMSIQEIAEQLQMNSGKQSSHISQKLHHTGTWYIKLAKASSDISQTEEVKLIKKSNFKIKLVIFLLIIGLVAMLIDFYTDIPHHTRGKQDVQVLEPQKVTKKVKKTKNKSKAKKEFNGVSR